jgi:hypothetical protein
VVRAWSSPPARPGSARSAATPNSTPTMANARARARWPKTPSASTGRRRRSGRRRYSRSSEKLRAIPVYAVATATISTIRPTTPTRSRPAGSARRPAVAASEPVELEPPDDPVSRRRMPATATARTAMVLAPRADALAEARSAGGPAEPCRGREALPQSEGHEPDDDRDDHQHAGGAAEEADQRALLVGLPAAGQPIGARPVRRRHLRSGRDHGARPGCRDGALAALRYHRTRPRGPVHGGLPAVLRPG